MLTKTIRTLFAILILASLTLAQTRTITVKSGDDLTAAVRDYDEIIIPNELVFTGNFRFPAKTTATLIRALTPPPVFTRAIATHVLPKILTPNADPAVEILDADNYKFVGIDFGVAETVTLSFSVVRLGNGQETSVDQLPTNITFERCLIHGNTTGNMKRGLEGHAANLTLKDSSIYNIRGVGYETQAFASWNGAGPFNFENNYLEGATENVMFGGADAKIPNLVPSDIRFVRNTVYKPPSWNPRHPSYAGKRWTVKNLFELKNARRVHIEGNTFEGSWVDGQIGFAIVLTPRNQDGSNPWATVEDVTFINNIVKDAAGGVQMLGSDYPNPSQHLDRVKIENVLFINIGAALFGSNGRLFQITGNDARNVTINKITGFTTGNFFTFGDDPSQKHTGLRITDNIFGPAPNGYGIMGSGAGEGKSTLTAYAPTAVVTGNVFTGRNASIYPAGNFFPPDAASIGFIDLAAGNYGLSASSPFAGKGADVAAINAAIGGSVTPPQPPPTPNPPPTPPPTPPPAPVVPLETTSVPVIGMESATVAFTLSGPARARVEYGLEGAWTNTSAVQAAASTHLVILSGLRANRKYNYRIVIIDGAGVEVKSKAFTFTSCRACR